MWSSKNSEIFVKNSHLLKVLLHCHLPYPRDSSYFSQTCLCRLCKPKARISPPEAADHPGPSWSACSCPHRSETPRAEPEERKCYLWLNCISDVKTRNKTVLFSKDQTIKDSTLDFCRCISNMFCLWKHWNTSRFCQMESFNANIHVSAWDRDEWYKWVLSVRTTQFLVLLDKEKSSEPSVLIFRL